VRSTVPLGGRAHRRCETADVTETDDGAIREVLRRHLRERMVARDRPAAQAIRSAVAAIENAEAQPTDGSSATEQLLAASTSADVARRVVSDEEARAVVVAEIDELDAAARHHRSIGRSDSAVTIEGQADLLRRILAT
jgi:uncharacterized protein